MTAVSKFLAAGAGIAALASAAPAAAQYYPGTGYGYGGGDLLSTIINSVLGGQRYGQQYGYGRDPQRERWLVEQCANATQYRLQRNYGSNASYGYGGYGYANAGAQARIVNITSVQRRSGGGLRIYGTATSGRSAYGGGYNGGYGGYNGGYGGYGGYAGGYSPYGGGYAQAAADLRFDCTIDYRGRVTDIDLERNRYGY